MNHFIKCFICLCLLGNVASLRAQQHYDPPFHTEIAHFRKGDSLHFPLKNIILFVGSSSFTKWTDVQDYFPRHKIINRGFGGSSLPDVIRYANDIIYPYQPKQVVIYCGDNDFAVSAKTTAEDVIFRVKTLFSMIRIMLPETRIDYVSIKYSPSRKNMWAKITAANKGIAAFFKTQQNAAYIDITKPMSKGKETVDESLFLEDMLHMKPSGYIIWKKTIEPYLMNN